MITQLFSYSVFQFPDERKWALQNDCWLPEHSDHPLQGEPTRLGPIVKQQNAERHPIHINRTDTHPFHRSKTLPDIRYSLASLVLLGLA